MSTRQEPAFQLSCRFTTQAYCGLSLLQDQQHACRHRLQDSLRFSLIHSTRSKPAPFATISSRQQLSSTWQPLFSLSSLTDAGSTSDIGSSDAASRSRSSAGASSSGYQSSSESDSQDYSSSDVNLDKIHCQLCNQPLSKPGGSRSGFFGRRKKSPKSSSRRNNILVCDCCQRCFHELCCADKGIDTQEHKGIWYHSSSCQQCQQGVKQQVALGRCHLPEGRSWQLVDCAPVNPNKHEGGLKALQALKRNLGDVLDVLLPYYGPGVAQQLVDTVKGYAVLLRQEDLPVTAGLLDVYGQELAVLDVVATRIEEQGKGHCSALLGAVEDWLGPKLGVDCLVAVCPADEPLTVNLWQQKFGFKRTNPKQLKQLQTTLPALSYYEESVLLSKQLPKKQNTSQH